MKLAINGLKLNVHLGWEEEERSQLQTVLLDAEIGFPALTKGSYSDQLKDTSCYHDLILHIHKFLEPKSFRLIESLGCQLFQLIKTKIPPVASLKLSITKHPKIPGLTHGIRFTCDDSDFKE